MKCLYCRADNEPGRDKCKKCGASLDNASRKEVKNTFSDTNLNEITNQTIRNFFPSSKVNKVKKSSGFFKIIIIVIIIGGFIYLKNNNFDIEGIKKNLEKKKVVDTDKPTQKENYDVNRSFKLTIKEIKSTDKGLSITGVIESGTVKTGDVIEIIRTDKESLIAKAKTLQIFNTDTDSAKAGDSVSIIVDNIDINDISVGDIVASPNTINNN